ncbi:lipase [Haloferula helveola]|uniref:Lipase n=2 Tax=Haloferula helveola TaxID=490095 RepID=A0ABM7RE29_9BACT|nr:lipase [Haloferula helveola]
MKAATPLSYLETPQGPLNAHFFVPHDFEPGQQRPLVVFFHGGFWDGSMPTQFVPQCLHFATRGALAVAVETRVESIHGTGAIEALEDARTFLGWLAEHGDRLGIDFDKLVLGGASGGAWLALQQVLPKPREESPLPMPKALVLFSALLDTSQASVVKRFPDAGSARRHSPLRQLRRKLPPMLFCHGKNDRVTPFEDARRFVRGLKWRRNPAEFLEFEKAEHSFFNFNVSEMHYELTLKAADRFLVDLGILEPDELDGLV